MLPPPTGYLDIRFVQLFVLPSHRCHFPFLFQSIITFPIFPETQHRILFLSCKPSEPLCFSEHIPVDGLKYTEPVSYGTPFIEQLELICIYQFPLFYLNCIIIIRLSLQKPVFSPDNPVIPLIQNSYHSLLHYIPASAICLSARF